MLRIAGRNLKESHQLTFGFSVIKGIGKSNIKKIIETIYEKALKDKKIDSKIDLISFRKTKLKDLSEDLVVLFRNTIENDFLCEEDLRRKEKIDVDRLINLGTWRGRRHKLGLPVRGQTTRTNSRTRRGNKRLTKGSGRIKSADKT